jgi:hypothetical protein
MNAGAACTDRGHNSAAASNRHCIHRRRVYRMVTMLVFMLGVVVGFLLFPIVLVFLVERDPLTLASRIKAQPS